MNKRVVLLLLTYSIFTACVPKKIEQEQSGKVDVNINFVFLDQLHSLCTDYYANVTFSSKEEHDHVVAECVFSHLEGAGTKASDITGFMDKYCLSTSDLSGLTEAQLTQIHAACAALGL